MKFIVVDTREKPEAIKPILAQFDKAGIDHISSKLPFGDYMDWKNPSLVIDRKKNIAELAKNCTVEQKRFRAEIELATRAGSQLVILVGQKSFKANGKMIRINELSDIIYWSNKYTSIKGEKVFRVIHTFINRYGIQVKFCDPQNMGKEIINILYGEIIK